MALLSQYFQLGTVAGATKAAACVVTLDAASCPPKINTGQRVHVRATGWPSLDGKWFVAGTVTATTIVLTGADTTLEAGTASTNGVLTADALPSERRV